MSKNQTGTKPLSVTIADTLKHTAAKTMETMFRAYHAKGGVAEMEAKLEQKRSGLAQGIFELAVTAARLGDKKLSWTEAYFKAICKAAETEFKETHADVENIKEALPCWPVFKSEILRAINDGLSPADFDNYGALKSARMEQSRASRESTEMRTGERAAGTEGAEQSGTNIAPALGAGKTTVTAKLAACLTVLQGAITGMEQDTQDAFAEELAMLIAKYGNKVQPSEKVDDKAAQAA